MLRGLFFFLSLPKRKRDAPIDALQNRCAGTRGGILRVRIHSSLSVLENAGTTTTGGGVGRKQRRMTEENDGKGGEEKEDEKNESGRSPTIVVGSKPREVAEEMLEKESTKKETKNASSKCTEEEQKLRILLVEDDIPTSLIITSMLTQAGAVVTNASNGKQAVERLRDNKYHEKIDLILTDIMMPEVEPDRVVLDFIKESEIERSADNSDVGERPFGSNWGGFE